MDDVIKETRKEKDRRPKRYGNLTFDMPLRRRRTSKQYLEYKNMTDYNVTLQIISLYRIDEKHNEINRDETKTRRHENKNNDQ